MIRLTGIHICHDPGSSSDRGVLAEAAEVRFRENVCGTFSSQAFVQQALSRMVIDPSVANLILNTNTMPKLLTLTTQHPGDVSYSHFVRLFADLNSCINPGQACSWYLCAGRCYRSKRQQRGAQLTVF